MILFLTILSSLLCSVQSQCADTPNISIRVGEDRLTCTQLASQYPYFCSGQLGAAGGHCCASCSALSPDALTCTDLPGSRLSIPSAGIHDKSCAELAVQYPAICEPDFWGGEGDACCSSCQGVNVQCTDTPNRLQFFADGPLLTCAELATQYPYLCTIANGIGANPGGSCCQACSGIAPEVLQCTDFPWSTLSLTGTNLVNKTCAELAIASPSICDPSLWGGDGNTCCKSCQGVDSSCTDTPASFSPFTGAPAMTCSEIAAQYPALCTGSLASNPGGSCCASCSDLAPNALTCTDLPGPSLGISSMGISGKTCQEMAVEYPKICDPQIWGGDGNTCCSSCQGVDYETCVDHVGTVTLYHHGGTSTTDTCSSLAMGGHCGDFHLGGIGNTCCASCPCTDSTSASVTVRANGQRCVNCSCQQLLNMSIHHLKKACCNNVNRAATDCCHTCKTYVTC